MRYTRLTNFVNKRIFNPALKEDLKELKFFLKNKRWISNCPFYLEDNWDNIPTMCMQKYSEYMLSKVK